MTNRCSLKPLTPETPEITLLLVCPPRRLALQVVCRRRPRFQLPNPSSEARLPTQAPATAARTRLGNAHRERTAARAIGLWQPPHVKQRKPFKYIPRPPHGGVSTRTNLRFDTLHDQPSNPSGGHRLFLPGDFSFQPFSVSAFQLFASWPVEQRVLGLLLSGGDFDQAVNEMGAKWPGTSSIVIGPTYGLTRLRRR